MKLLSKSLIIFFLFGAFSVASASTIARPMNNSGLVGYWNFEEGVRSSTVLDRSGSGVYGTLINMDTTSSWTNGATTTGQALSFDGTNDYVDTKIDDPLDLTGAMTISVWVFHRSNATTQHIVSKNNNPAESPFQLALIASTNVVRWYHANGVNSDLISSTDAVSLNSWHHIVAVRTATQITFYIDGVQDSAGWQNYNAGYPAASAVSVKIGARGDAGSAFFDGKIDELRIYNRALSSDEVARLYKLQKPKVSSGIDNTSLAGYWPLDEGQGTRAEDHSFNGNNGTLTGGPTWATGRNGKAALSFVGASSQYVNIPSSLGVGTANFTIVGWAYRANTGDHGAFVKIGGGNGGVGIGISNGGTTGFETSGDLLTALYEGGRWIATTQNFGTGWHQFALVVDNSGFPTVYYDGTNIYNDSGSGPSAPGSAQTQIGGYSSTVPSNRYYTGKLDDVRVYNRALSATEIKNLYTNGAKVSSVNTSKTNRLTDGLVGYWTFDGNKIYGTTAYDSSPEGNNGVLTSGPVQSLGRIGQALNFDGVDDLVRVSTPSTNITNMTSWTVAAWIYRTTASVQGAIWIKGGSFNAKKSFAVNTDGSLYSFINTSSTNRTVTSAAGAVPLNTWKFVVLRYTPGDGGARFYVDGVETSYSARTDGNGSDVSDSGLAIEIGNRVNNDLGFNGKIDDVRVYNRALSVQEIQALYNMGR